MCFLPARVDSNHHDRALVEQLILVADAAVRYRATIYRDRFRLSEVQYRLLAHVAGEGPVSLSELSQLVNRDCGQVSRTVRALVDAGLLTSARRGSTPSRTIELTPKGFATYAEMAAVTSAWEDAVKARLSTAQVASASEAIRCLREAAIEFVDEDSAALGACAGALASCPSVRGSGSALPDRERSTHCHRWQLPRLGRHANR